jgi:hypothetical protein
MIGLTTLKNKILINIFICLNPLTRCVCVSSAARAAAVGKSADRGVFFLMGFNFAVKFFCSSCSMEYCFGGGSVLARAS